MKLVRSCQDLRPAVKLVSRLPLNAVLHDPPAPQPASKRGPKPQKGPRQPTLAQRLLDQATTWEGVEVPWYGGHTKHVELISGTSLWYHSGFRPAPIRWVLLRCPGDPAFKPMALFCSDPDVAALLIVDAYVGRWNPEVTFEELRAQLGFETQRGWCDRTIERTTPSLFSTFSLVVLMAHVRHPVHLPLRQTAWYPKDEATLSDALAAVRRDLWGVPKYEEAAPSAAVLHFPASAINTLLEAVAYAA